MNFEFENKVFSTGHICDFLKTSRKKIYLGNDIGKRFAIIFRQDSESRVAESLNMSYECTE